MLVLVGFIVVILSILVGFTMAGGNLALILQWSEFLIIIGTAMGSLLIMAPISLVKKIFASIPRMFKSDHTSKQDYLDLLKSFNDLFLIAQRDGMLSLEPHIEDPKKSKILSTNKKFLENEAAVQFFCDTMKVLLSGAITPHELETLVETEIETYEMELKPVASTIQTLADAFPGIGIVAAVLGIIVTMGSINEGAEAVGHHVAAALVGTFLGVLMAYGFVSPIATNIEHENESKVRYLQTIASCITAYAKGNPPMITVEVARRTIFSDNRPTFNELENYLRGKKGK